MQSKNHIQKAAVSTRQKIASGLAIVAALAASVVPGLTGGALQVAQAAVNPQPIQTFYVPLPEDQMLVSFKVIAGSSYASTLNTTMHDVIGIAVSTNGTIIYYDQWEDGYELDIANRVKTTTQIWGDGNAANGAPPGIPSDILNAGTVINLENDIPMPRNAANLFYDGRDKFASTQPIAASRSVWNTGPGGQLSDATEMYDIVRWGTSYKVPVGINTATTDQIFEYTALFVMASKDGTVVTIDKDGNGSIDITTTLNQGQSYQLNGGVSSNASVTASKPVQVDLITGDINSNYENRWYTLPPTDQLDSSYYTPVGTTNASYPSTVWVYNPNASAITVNVTTQAGNSTLSVPAGGTVRYQMPNNTAARFYTSSGSTFMAVGTIDTSTGNPSANQLADWGYSLVPEAWLTTGLVVGWGPGGYNAPSTNASPVWVTAVKPTTIYVDYDGNPTTGPLTDSKGNKYNVSYNLGAYQFVTIYDTADNNQTGMKVYTLDGTYIAGAWGQNPKDAIGGRPDQLDMGTTIPPLPEVTVKKTAGLATDVNSNGLLDPGDTLAYTLTLNNRGVVILAGTIASDTIPANTTYVAGSTRLNGAAVADAANPTTIFPLDEGGLNVGVIPIGGKADVTFRVTANAFPPVYISVVNTGLFSTTIGTFTGTVTTLVNPGNVTACTLDFTNATGTPVISYQQNGPVTIQVGDADKNTNAAAAETLQVTLINQNTGDRETVTLTETGVNTGIFRGSLPSSVTGGLSVEDGTINASANNTLQATYTDPIFGDTCTDTATIAPPTVVKPLYLSTDGTGNPDQDLDRVDPVATGDATTALSTLLGSTGGGPVSTFATPTDISNQFGGEDALTPDLAVYESGGTETLHTVFLGKATGAAKKNIYYSTKTGAGAWTTPVRISDDLFNQDAQVYPSIAVDGSNKAFVVYAHKSSTDNKINVYYVTNTSGAWSAPVRISSDAFNQDASTPEIALDASGKAYVVYQHKSGTDSKKNIYYVTNASGAWSTPVRISDDAFNQDVDLNPAIAIDGANKAHVAYVHKSGTDAKKNIYYVTNTSGAWSAPARISDDLFNQDVQPNPAIKMDSNGKPHVVYGHKSGSDAKINIYYVNKVAVSWSTPVDLSNDVNAQDSGNPDLAISSTGIIRVAFSNRNQDIFYTENSGSGSSWITPVDINPTTPTKSDSGDNPSIALASQTVHVVFQDKHVSLGTKVDVWHTAASLGGGSSISSTTFTQTLSMGSSFAMPVGGQITVTTYVSGSLGANGTKLVTSTLRYNGTTFATLTNPIYDGTAGTLVWTGSLASNTTVPAGQAISLTVTSGITNSFQIRYDSATYPSRIQLPTTTAIDVGSIGFYAAAYPSIVPGQPKSAQKTYIRVPITDPFGPTDVNTVTLVITDPLGVATSVVLTSTSVVSTSANTKVVEYAWTPSATQGGYTLTVTANEGTEGITDQSTLPLDVRFDDVGSPSTTEFTASNNGAPAEVYNPNDPVCVRVTDLDQNLDSLVIETITATIRSSGGDSEVVTLTETAANSGVFSVCIPASSTTVGTPNNGTLYAPAGAALTVVYVDPNYSLDTSSDAAAVTTPTPALALSKIRLLPLDTIAAVGELVQFDLGINNPGPTVLNVITVTDAFTASCLAYESASITPTTVLTPNLTWVIGPIASPGNQNISVNFRVVGVCSPTTNVITATARDENNTAVTGVQASAQVTTTRPAITVSKTLVAPLAGPVAFSNTLSYRIIVTNTGSTTIPTLPLTDNYSDFCHQYVSSSPVADGSGGGLVTWNNLGSLAVGASTSVSVTFRVTGVCSPALDDAIVDQAVDVNGDLVPLAQASASVATTVLPPQIQMAKALVSPLTSTVGLNDVLTYTIRITNTGPNAITGLVLTDTWDTSCISFTNAVELTPTQVLTTGQATWNTFVPPVPPVFPGQTTTLTMGFVATSVKASCVNTATVAGFDQFGQTVGPLTSTVPITVGAANLVITKSSQPKPAIPGQPLTYTVVVTNNGPSDALGVVISDTLPQSVTYSSHIASQGIFTSATRIWDVGTLSRTKAATLTLVVNVNPAAVATLTNVVTTTASSPITGTLVATDTNTPAQTILRGVITDSLSGVPIPGAVVTVTDSVGNVYTTTTDPTGAYTFTSTITKPLASGPATVQAAADGYVPNSAAPTLVGGTTNTQNLPLTPNTLSGVVTDTVTGLPIPGATVIFTDSNGTVFTTTTGPTGAYAFTGTVTNTLSAGTGTLTASAPGYSPATGYTPSTTINPGANTKNAPLTPTRLTGVVTDSISGLPIPSTVVTFTDSAGTVFTTTTDPTGAYTFTATITKPIATGTGTVNASKPGYITDPGYSPTTVITPGNNVKNVSLQPVGTVGGTVFEDYNTSGIQGLGEPGLPSVVVSLTTSTGAVITTTTGPNGVYTFTNVPAALYTVTVTPSPGYTPTTPSTLTNTLTPGGSQLTNNFGLWRPASIGNFVWSDLNHDGFQDSGEPGIGGVTVTLTTPTGTISTQTDANGLYTFTNLISGTYSAAFSLPAGYTYTLQDRFTDAFDSDVNPATGATASFPLNAGQTNTTIDAGLRPIGAITGTVFQDTDGDGVQDAGEPGLPNVTILITDSLGVTRTVTTDPNGIYTATNVPTGTATVDVVNSTLPPGSAQTAGTDPSTVSVPLGGVGDAGKDGYQPRGDLYGHIFIDTDGNGLQNGAEPNLDNIRVVITDALGVARTVTTDASGNYTATNVPSGTATVDVVESTLPSGYVQTAGTDPNTATVNPGVLNFAGNDGYQPLGNLGGTVFEDFNNSGIQGLNEPGLPTIVVTLTTSAGSVITTTTDPTGIYTFTAVPGGSYTITVTTLPGYTPSTPSTLTGNLPAGSSLLNNNFGEWRPASVGDRVWEDYNHDGFQDVGEPGISNVIVTLQTPTGTLTTTTNSSGLYTFTNLISGTFVATFSAPSPLPGGSAGYTGTLQDRFGDASDSDTDPITGATASFVVNAGESLTNVDAGFWRPATLGNRVWEDYDNDGQQDAGEPGIPGVLVALQTPTGTMTTTTNASGLYSFTNLISGTHVATFTAPGGYTGTVANVGSDLTDSDANPVTGVTGPINVTAGATLTNLDVGFVDAGFFRPATLGDRVWEDYNHDGFQDAGEPGIGSVLVTLQTPTGTVTTTTDANGIYTFTNLISGTYVATFTAPVGFTGTLQDRFTDANDSDANPTTGTTAPFVVNAGETVTNVDAGFWRPATLGDFVWSDTNRDGYQDAGEPGLQNVTVTLNTPTGTLVTTTDANGLYTFTNLISGTYSVTFGLPNGYGYTLLDQFANDARDSDVNPATGSTANITLNAGDSNTSVDVGLQPAGTVTGAVFQDTNGNGTQDAGEPGLPNISVLITDSLGLTRTVTTDPNGVYTATNVPVGTATVDVVDSTLPLGSAQTAGTDPSTVSVPLGGVGNAGKDGYQPRGDLYGHIFVDTDGNGLQNGAEPNLSSISVIITDSLGVTRTVTTDASGNYTATNVPSGTATVDVVESTLPAGYVQTAGTDPTSATVNPGVLNFAGNDGYQPRGSVNGTLYVDKNNDGSYTPGTDTPLSGVDVVITDSLGVTRTVTTDPNGFFSVTVPAGSTVVDADDADIPLGLGLAPGSTDPTTVTVPSGGVATDNTGYLRQYVEGTVYVDVNEDGSFTSGVDLALPNITVVITDAAGAVRTVQTDANGYFSQSVASGNAVVDVRDSDLPTAAILTSDANGEGNDPTTVNVPPAGVGQDNTGYRLPGTVRGVVFKDTSGDGTQDPGENGLGGVTVELIGPTGNVVSTTTTAPNGTYQFSNIPPGAYTVKETDPTNYTSTTNNVVQVNVPQNSMAVANFGDRQIGTVAGIVFNDINGDGLQDPGEAPLSNVTIRLYDENGSVVSTTTTLSDGTYVFSNVIPGAYTVRETDPVNYTSTTANTVAVSVPANGIGTANFGDRQIGTVAGVVFDDKNGDGTQDPGEGPLSGVTIQLLDSNGAVLSTTMTITDGSYLFPSVAPGTYTVRETDPLSYTSTTANSVPVSVPANGIGTANFGDRQIGTVSGVVFDDANGDGTQDPLENGIGGVTVQLLDTNGTVVSTTTTAPGTGAYSFVNVPPGSYTVKETDPTNYTSTTNNSVPVSVPASGSASANFGDRQIGTVSGVVFDDKNGDGTQDPGENGLGGVTVQLVNSSGTVVSTTTTAGDGSYLFQYVVPGSYTVSETDPTDYTSTTANSVPVSVPPNGVGIANFGDRQIGTVSGVVFDDKNGDGLQDPGEGPLAGVTIRLYDNNGAVVSTTTTAGDGSYLFPNVVPGAYSVKETDPTDYTSTTANSVPVSVPPNGAGTANFGDRQIGTVSGVVFNDKNGDGTQDPGEGPLGGVTVQLLDSNGNVISTTTTAGDGSYLFPDVAPGSYTVRETDPLDYTSTTANSVPVSVPANGIGTANFGDRQIGTVSGLVFDDKNGDGVQDPGENPIGGVTIQLLDSNGTVITTTTTAGDGTFLIQDVAPGAYTLKETDPLNYTSTTPNSVPVSVAPNGAASALFGDRQIGTVSGVVFDDKNGDGTQDPGEGPLAGVTIQLLDSSGAVVSATTTAGDGSYLFPNVAPGAYTVKEADPTNYTSTTTNSVDVSVPPNGIGTANFGDRQIGTVAGVVFNDINGDGLQDVGEGPLSGVTVRLFNSAGSVVSTTTTAGDGSYLFENVAPGSYTVKETDPLDYTSTTANSVPVSVPPNGIGTANFGDRQIGTVSGVVFDDKNGDGTQDPGEGPLGGVTVQLLDSNGNPISTTTTAGDGTYLFQDIAPGAYTVKETDPTDYTSTTTNSVPVSVPANGSASANFGDRQIGTVSGVVFDDKNGDGTQDPGEGPLGGVTIQLINSSGAVISTTTTAGDGSYLFQDVAPGSYSVKETDPLDYTSTTANTVSVSVPPNGIGTANFGDRQIGTVSGVVFDDKNGDGTQDPGEGPLAGVTIQLLDTNGAVVGTTTTAGDGSYAFPNVAPGSYSVQETDPINYTSTTANSVPVSVPANGIGTANFGDRQIGTVAGVVFDDKNGDGAQDLGEGPLGGVTIQLVNSSGTVISTTTTAGDGSYLFQFVAPGSYTVKETDPTDYTSTTANTVAVSVPPNGIGTANFGDRQIGTVAGVVFEDKDGDGLQDPGENGLGGVTVQLLDSSGNPISTTTTVGDGSYTFVDVPPGAYTVKETDPTDYTSTTNNSVPVSVPANGSASANFGDRQIGTVAGVAFNDINGDGTQDVGENPLSGVTIRLYDSNGAVISTTTTAGDGSYLFPNVPPGSYSVKETDPLDYTSTTANTVSVSVPPNGVGTANFGDRQIGTVSGAVFDDKNGDGVQQPGENPLGGVIVQLLDNDNQVVSTTTTAGDGTYTFVDVAPGAYAVQETDPTNYTSTTANIVPINVPANGSATANFGDRQIGTVSGVAFDDKNADGVQDPGEGPLGGVTIQLVDGNGTVVSTTTTAGDGSYLFQNVAPGSYTVRETDPANYVSTTNNVVPVSVPPNGVGIANFGDRQIGTVAGVVFEDKDGDGLQDPGEGPLGGVTVQLLDSNGNPISTTTTAGDGSYLFPNVPPGSYTVSETDPTNYTSTTPNSVPVNVTPNSVGAANFGDRVIGTVTGVVFDDKNGDGVQDVGENPLSGVTIRLYDGAGNVVSTTTTAGDGSYLFENVAPGSYSVKETDPTDYTSTTNNTVSVSVPPNGVGTANFGDRQIGTVSGVVFNDTNGDGTQDPGEGPLGGVPVQLVDGNGAVVSTTTTAGDGSYLFQNVAPGAYTVKETDPTDYTSTTANTVEVSVPANGSATANFGDRQIGMVSGVVFDDKNGDGVKDVGENPLGGVTIQLIDSSGTVIRTTTTAGDGSYLFLDVAPGSYTVQETDPANYTSTTNNVVPVSVPANGSATANFGDRQIGTVAGVVFDDKNADGLQDPGENPLSGVTVQLLDDNGNPISTTTTNGDGSYTFVNVAPGSYTVQETDPTNYTSTTNNRVPVSVAANGTATANFGDRQIGTVAGVVFNDKNGDGLQDSGEDGLSGVTVRLHDSAGNVVSTTTTAGDGSYLFENVAPGSYTVKETDPANYTSTTANTVGVSVPVNGIGTANFGDRQIGTVAGVVFDDKNGDGLQDPGENGLGGVTVQLVDNDGNVVTTTTTAGDGSYLIPNVAPGAYTVKETDPSGYTSTTANTVPINVPANGIGTANFGDRQVGTVAGVVFNDTSGDGLQDPGEDGIGGVTVRLFSSNGTVISTTTTAGDGSYLFQNVPPGGYIVKETDPTDYTSTTNNTVPVSVAANGTATANFGDRQIGTVAGVVFDDKNANGVQDTGENPIGGVTIQLLDNDGQVVSTTTTAGDGSYLFQYVTPGAYTVKETDPTDYTSTTNNTVPVSVPANGTGVANFGDRQIGTVAGVVFNDANADGLQQAGEDGLGGVTVQLLNSSGAVVSTTTTAGDGSYLFTEVPPGAYTVKETDPADYTSTTNNSVPVSVPANGTATANFGDRQIGTVSGVVFDDTNGDGVQQPGEDPIGGVTVELLDKLGNVIGTATTAGDGSYLFTNVPVGSYTVKETDPTDYTSTTNNSLPVNVLPNGAATANFGDRQIGTVAGMVFDDRNSNGVQDTGENPIGGVTVELLNSSGGVVGTATTASDGSYLFTNVPVGSYTVKETDPTDYVSTTSNNVAVTVPANGIGTANFGDRQIGTVAGIVFDDKNADGVQQAGEAPIGGVRIELLDGSGNVVGTTTTAGDGSYLFINVQPGSYSVKETDPDSYVSTTNNNVPVTVPANGVGTANFGDRQIGTVAGVVFNDKNSNGVKDPGEEPIGGVTVDLLDATGNVIATTTTGSDGSYVFTNVPAGNYTVRASDPPEFSSTTPNSVPLTVPPDGIGTVNFGDRQAGTVVGQVFQDTNGNGRQDAGEPGIPNVSVLITDSLGLTRTVTTDANGIYTATNVPTGTASVDVVNSTLPPGALDTTNVDPSTVNVSATDVSNAGKDGYRVVGGVSGIVFEDVNGNGSPTPDAGELGKPGIPVTLTASDGSVLTTVTGPDGSYSFPNVPSGPYTVTVGVPNNYANTTPNPVTGVLPPGGSVPNNNVGVQGRGTVTGELYVDLNGNGVHDPGEEPIPGQVVTLTTSTGVVTTTTKSDGSYNFPNVPVGPFTVTVTAPPQYQQPQGVGEILPNPGSTVDVPFGLIPMPSLTMSKRTITKDTTVKVGEFITYVLVAKNAGPGLAMNVVITDPVKAGLEYVAGSANPSAAFANNELRWTTAQLGIDESFTVTFVARVVPMPNGEMRTTVNNKAYVVATMAGPGNTPQPQVNANGEANVELSPSAVVLRSFTATWSDSVVNVAWETSSEVDTFGFLIYRSETKERSQAVRVSDAMIASTSVNSGGSTYAFTDTTAEVGKTYYYWLQEAETDGDTNDYGPAGTDGTSINAPRPTKVFLPLIAN